MYCDIPEFGRCCFCLPLRRGVITFGYINALFSCFLLGVYSYATHHEQSYHELLYHGAISRVAPEVCVAVYCVEIIASIVLLYGAHLRIVKYVRIYYYFSITTTVAVLLMQVVEMFRLYPWFIIEFITFGFAGFCLQVYLLILVRSLMLKMEKNGPHQYENQLNEIVTAGDKIVTNEYGTDNSNTLPK